MKKHHPYDGNPSQSVDASEPLIHREEYNEISGKRELYLNGGSWTGDVELTTTFILIHFKLLKYKKYRIWNFLSIMKLLSLYLKYYQIERCYIIEIYESRFVIDTILVFLKTYLNKRQVLVRIVCWIESDGESHILNSQNLLNILREVWFKYQKSEKRFSQEGNLHLMTYKMILTLSHIGRIRRIKKRM